jgi:hypothetical protein
MRLLGALLFAAVALGGGGGCGTPKPVLVDFSETPRNYLPKDYEPVFRRWTRHERALNDADVALEAWVTFKSWEFREAYVERYAAIYNLTEADRATLRAAQLEALRQAYEFHVTAQSTSWTWNDLEKSSSAWKVSLVDALGHEILPEYVKVLKLPDAYEREFFPNKNAFTKTYSIRFPVPGAGAPGDFAGVKSGSITLRFVSPIGHMDLTWQSGS